MNSNFKDLTTITPHMMKAAEAHAFFSGDVGSTVLDVEDEMFGHAFKRMVAVAPDLPVDSYVVFCAGIKIAEGISEGSARMIQRKFPDGAATIHKAYYSEAI